jgi:pyrimidine operon attenuation protein/uracil phosphoribosyltransferase
MYGRVLVLVDHSLVLTRTSSAMHSVVGEAARKAEVHLDLLLDQLSDINRKERRAASEYHIRSAHHRRGLRSKPN